MLEKEGYLVLRQGASRFPDMIAVKHNDVMFVEVKWNKYLSKEEKAEAKRIFEHTGLRLTVFYNKNRKIEKYEV